MPYQLSCSLSRNGHPMQTGWRTAAALDHRDLTRTLRLALWGHFGNKMGTGLAISAQCGYNARASGQHRNCPAIKAFKYHRNVFPIPRVWQTYRTQNPVLVRVCGRRSSRELLTHSTSRQDRAISMIACLTFGVGPRHAETRSRSTTQSRHSPNRTWMHLSQSESG